MWGKAGAIDVLKTIIIFTLMTFLKKIELLHMQRLIDLFYLFDLLYMAYSIIFHLYDSG